MNNALVLRIRNTNSPPKAHIVIQKGNHIDLIGRQPLNWMLINGHPYVKAEQKGR